ncbi:22572_t:CDS:2, partial [Rhizophagus irregularis]
MTTTDNSDIISLNLRFRNSQNRNVIFVIEVSKNDLVSVIADRVRGILAPHLPVRPHNFHLQQIYPTSIQRRRMQPENMILDYFPENPDEDMIHIFVEQMSLSQNLPGILFSGKLRIIPVNWGKLGYNFGIMEDLQFGKFCQNGRIPTEFLIQMLRNFS